jgi:hypothetical protein
MLADIAELERRKTAGIAPPEFTNTTDRRPAGAAGGA